MGLFKAVGSAIGSTLHDQWKEVIACEDMKNDILMMGKTTDTGVITKQSIIRVMPGQCAIIMQNGKVLDASAESGDYVFDESTAPSFFAGNFGAVFKEMWQRFTYGGGIPNQQVVYFFNMKEIMDNKFGTATPIPFQDWSHPVPNQMAGGVIPLAVKVKCYGKYTFKIEDPSLFMKEIAGTAMVYRKDQIVEQIRTEVISAFQNVLNELGTEEHKVPVLELPSQTDEIKEMMDEKIFDEPLRKRGLNIVCFAIESVSLDEKSEKYIQEYILSSNAHMQQGTLTQSYAKAVENAASNESGAMNGFLGVGMMNMAGGGIFGQTMNNVNEGVKNSVNSNTLDEVAGAWQCPNCNKMNKGNYCEDCGTKKPEESKCPKCGKTVNSSQKYCPHCGEKLSD